SSRRRHTRSKRDWSSDVCSSDLAEGIRQAVTGADIVIILTEWQEIKEFPLEEYKKLMNEPVIFDGRNCFTLKEAENSGVEYHSKIGRASCRERVEIA